MSWPSRIWELGERSEIIHQLSLPTQSLLACAVYHAGKWFGELWNVDIGCATESACPRILGALSSLVFTLHVHISIEATSFYQWPWSPTPTVDRTRIQHLIRTGPIRTSPPKIWHYSWERSVSLWSSWTCKVRSGQWLFFSAKVDVLKQRKLKKYRERQM